MDEQKPQTRKEVATDDRADPGEDGAWFWLRGKDAVRILRSFARWDSATRVIGLLLLGACATFLGLIALAIRDCVPYLRTIQERLGD